jgi:hypothetical protein
MFKIWEASGPDGVDNMLLKESVAHLQLPFVNYLITVFKIVISHHFGRLLMYAQFIKSELVHLCQITGLYLCYQQ